MNVDLRKTIKKSLFEVYKNRVLVKTGTNFECFKFILDNQPQSVNWAERYDGWVMGQKNK